MSVRTLTNAGGKDRLTLEGIGSCLVGIAFGTAFALSIYFENEWDSYDVDCTPENWDLCNPNGGYMDDLIFEICKDAECY